MEGVWRLTREYDMLPAGGRILCAVSGGADSMCLLHLLHGMAARGEYRIFAAHYNHQLRGGEAEEDEAFVADWCRANAIAFTAGRGDVRREAEDRRKGLEETARQMRYQFLTETAAALRCNRIATAHHADDNAETILLHLVRGCGLQGLTGIAPRRDALIRPLLTTPRADILGYLEKNQIPFREDSSNEDERFTRNRLRRQVLPVMYALNPRFGSAVGQTAALLRADEAYLTEQARAALSGARRENGAVAVEVAALRSLPEPVAARGVRLLLEMQGGDAGHDCTAAHIDGVLRLCRGEAPSGKFFLPGGRLIRRIYGTLYVTEEQPQPKPFSPVPLVEDGVTQLPGTGWRVCCRPVLCPAEGEGGYYLARDKLHGALCLRPRRTGDRITLPGRPGKTVKKLLIEEKVPRHLRDSIPVLADALGLVALAGFGPDQARLAAAGEAAYQVTFTKLARIAGEDG